MLSIKFSLMKCGEWDFRIPIIRHSGAIVHLRRSSFFIIAPSKTETCKSALKKTYRAQMKLSRRIFFRFLHAVDSWINYLCEAIRRESYFSVRRKKFKGFFPEKKKPLLFFTHQQIKHEELCFFQAFPVKQLADSIDHYFPKFWMINIWTCLSLFCHLSRKFPTAKCLVF